MASVVVNGDTSGAVTLSAPAVAGTVTVTLPSTTGTMLTTASTTGISGGAISSGTVAEAYGGTGTSTGYYGFKSRIINGAMVIDQRGTASAAVSLTTSNQYTVDRWACATGSAPSGTIYGYQVATSTYPFTKALRLYKFAGTYSGNMFATQVIESNNCYDLAGQSVTVSFQARRGSDFAGTLACGVVTGTGTDQGVNGSTGGSWTGYASTTAVSATSLTTSFVTYTGTVSVPAGTNEISINFVNAHTGNAGSSNNWIEITGVQLEKGSTATSFDYRPYGTEFMLCQRYFQLTGAGSVGSCWGNTFALAASNLDIHIKCMVPMRATPSSPTLTSGTGAVYSSGNAGVNFTQTSTFLSTNTHVGLSGTVSSGGISGLTFYLNGDIAQLNAEL